MFFHSITIKISKLFLNTIVLREVLEFALSILIVLKLNLKLVVLINLLLLHPLLLANLLIFFLLEIWLTQINAER